MQKNNRPLALASLISTGKRYNLPKGQVINAAGNDLGLAMVESGYIKRYLITSEGNQSIQSIYGREQIFPLTPVYKALLNLEIYDGAEILYYEAMSDTRVRVVSLEALEHEASTNPHIYKDLFYVAGLRLNSNIHHLENISLANVYRRLVHQLLYLSKEFGEDTVEGLQIMVPLSTNDLAGLLNVSRETVSRNFSRLQAKGLVKNGKIITIPDIEKLRQEINK